MGTNRFDELSRAAGKGMSRRKVLRIMVFGGAAGAAAGLGVKGAGAKVAAASQTGAASPQLGGLCTTLLGLAGSLSGLPIVGALIGG